jgi:hypothetical protein
MELNKLVVKEVAETKPEEKVEEAEPHIAEPAVVKNRKMTIEIPEDEENHDNAPCSSEVTEATPTKIEIIESKIDKGSKAKSP